MNDNFEPSPLDQPEYQRIKDFIMEAGQCGMRISKLETQVPYSLRENPSMELFLDKIAKISFGLMAFTLQIHSNAELLLRSIEHYKIPNEETHEVVGNAIERILQHLGEDNKEILPAFIYLLNEKAMPIPSEEQLRQIPNGEKLKFIIEEIKAFREHWPHTLRDLKETMMKEIETHAMPLSKP